MVAETRRRRLVTVVRAESSIRNTNEGSRFAILAEKNDVLVQPAGEVIPNNSLPRGPIAVIHSGQDLSVSRSAKQSDKNSAYKVSNPDRKKKDVSKAVGAVGVIPIVGNQDVEVIPHISKQLSENHMAISIVEPYDSSQKPVGGKVVKARKNMMDGKRGLQIRKSIELRPPPKPNMSD
ncbi:hypothetical protein V6N13_047606 [Hibiscus sabdariffa]|uniref:Uncharacterized protein n=1 Tax=Hibiscus sabdariffa TaxID=183260 RepID=A0ABR2F4P9_9ROSI